MFECDKYLLLSIKCVNSSKYGPIPVLNIKKNTTKQDVRFL